MLDIQEGRQLVTVAMFEVVILVAIGPPVYRLLLAPLLFLFFLVPSGAFLVPSLQRITTSITIIGLHALQIPVYSDGYMIEIPEGPFEIAEACAGLRFLIASIVFGCFFAVLMYRSLLWRTVFIRQAHAALFGHSPLAALVALSASKDAPGTPAEQQLSRFLEASQSVADYINALSR